MKRNKRIVIYVNDKLMERIEQVAQKLSLSRSELARWSTVEKTRELEDEVDNE